MIERAFWTSGGTLIGYAMVRTLTGNTDDAFFATVVAVVCVAIASVIFIAKGYLSPSQGEEKP